MNLAQRDWDRANTERISDLLNETENYSGKGFECTIGNASFTWN
jgi:hypothetical protein